MLDAVTKGYLALHPEAAARALAKLDRRDAAEAFNAMPRQLAGQVLAHMAPASAARCLKVIPPVVAGEILARTVLPAAVAALRLVDEKHLLFCADAAYAAFQHTLIEHHLQRRSGSNVQRSA